MFDRKTCVAEWRKRNKAKSAQYAAKWRNKNRDKHNATRRRRHAEIIKNPAVKEKLRKINRAYREKNLDRCNENDRNWRSKNRDRYRATKRIWVSKNKQKDSESHRNSYFKHREARLVYRRNYYRSHKSEYQERDKRKLESDPKYNSRRHRKFYLKNQAYYKAKDLARRALRNSVSINTRGIRKFVAFTKSKPVVICYYCKNETPSFGCHFDHIIPLSKGGHHSVENLCVTCPSCNFSKGSKNLSEWTKLDQKLLPI